MHSRKMITVAVSLIIGVAGCATTRGPKPILSSAGVIDKTATSGVDKKFVDAAGASFDAPTDSAKAAGMMSTGYAYIYASCDDFFRSAGRTQKWIIFSRDAIGSIGTLATAVMALHDASDNAVANVAFGTGAIYSGLDVYTRNFLFSAQNVEAVRELVLKALVVHRQAVRTASDETYQTATMALLDNQNICSPMAIVGLVREAIKNGDVVADTNATGPNPVGKQQDQRILLALGQLLDPPGALSIAQARGLWWLLQESSTPAEKTNDIAPLLKDLPAATNPFDGTPALRPKWPHADQVRAELGGFSETTQQSFRDAIAAQRAATLAAGGARGAVVPPTPGTPESAPRTTRHVSVGVK